VAELCKNCQGPKCPFLRLSEGKRQKFAKIKERRSYRVGTPILRQGERSEGVFVVCSGLARLSHVQDGKRTTLGLAPPASVLGLAEVFTKSPSPVSVEALQDCELGHIPREKLVPFLLDTPKLSVDLMNQVSGELQRFLGMF